MADQKFPDSTDDITLKASRDQISEFVTKHEQEAFVAIKEYIRGALEELNLGTPNLSHARLTRAAHHFAKDIAKMKMYQEDSVSVTKYVGYLCFWIRKTAPVCIVHKNEDPEKKEGRNTADINAVVALFVMKNLLIDISANYTPNSWIEPYKEIINRDAEAFRERVSKFFQRYYFDLKHLDYTRHCMSVRTFGPHHMVMLCDFVVYGALFGLPSTLEA